jgi:hypothetical protein
MKTFARSFRLIWRVERRGGSDRVFTRGSRLLPVRGRYTLAQLAPELGCSTKRLRDFQELASIRGLARMGARKLGVKKALSTIRRNRKTFLRWQEQTTGQSGRKLKNKLAKHLSDWLQKSLPEWMWDPFFQQIFNEGCQCDEMKMFAPKLFEEFRFDGDWQEVIESTRPEGNPEDLRYTLLGYHIQWFATWYRRCMPFLAIGESVARRVRIHLRRTAWRRFGTTVLWTFRPPRK